MKLFRRFLLYFISAASLLTVVGFPVVQNYEKNRIETIYSREQGYLDVADHLVQKEIFERLGDIGVLSHAPVVIDYIENPSKDRYQKAAELFSINLKHYKVYDQLRYLDLQGQEVIRADLVGGMPVVLQPSQLQYKGDRDYFKASVNIDPEEAYISPMDLNIEHGKIQIPFKPVIRFAKPVFDRAGERRGVVVSNYFADGLRKKFIELFDHSRLGISVMLNANGYYLIGDKPASEWGHLLSHKDANFAKFHPDAWRVILRDKNGRLFNEQGLFLFKTINPLQHHTAQSKLASSSAHDDTDHQWILVRHIPNESLYASSIFRSASGWIWLALAYAVIAFSIFIATYYFEKLRERNEQHKALLENASDSVHILDEKGNIIEFSHSFASRLGYTDEEAARLNVTDWDGTLTRDQFENAIRAIVKSPATFETVHKRKDGSMFDVEVSARAMEVGGSTIVYASSRDITDRKKSAEILRTASLYARSLIEASLDPLVTISADGKVMDVNTATERVTGLTRDALIGTDFSDYFSEPGRARAGYQQVFTDGFVKDYPLTIRHKSGSTTDVLYNASVFLDESGQIQGVFAAARDITEHKKAEEAIANSQAILNEAQHIAHLGSWNWDLEDGTLKWSEEAAEILMPDNQGETPTLELFFQSLHKDDVEAVQAAVKASLELDEPYDIEYRIVSRSKGETFVHAQAKVFRDSFGKAIRMVGTVHDVSERKMAEALMQKAREEAELLAQSKAEFLANMSHEIRTPMNGIIGLSLLAINQPTTPEVRDYLQKISSSSQSLLGILNDILDFSKIEAGRISIENSTFDLDQMVDNLRNLFEEHAEAKFLDFKIEIAEGTPRDLIGDALRIQQILSNLIGNAIKFTAQGHIALRIGSKKLESSYAVLAFSVEDTGIGIAGEDLGKLFRPFSQVDGSITRRFGGTGLGLAISNKLLQLMGSDFEVTSDPGQGTTFSFDLLLGVSACTGVREARHRVKGEAGELGQELQQKGKLLKGARILVAEDNRINQQVVKEFLELSGMAVAIANNGQEVLDLLAKQPFDAILMDVHMPGMGGVEATQQIRRVPDHAEIPIIALTAGVTQEEKENCRASGMDDFVAKPIRPQELYDCLLHWIKPVNSKIIQPPSLVDRQAAEHDWADIATQLPDFDLRNLMIMLGGQRAPLLRMLKEFLNDFIGESASIVELVTKGHIDAAEKLLHRLKGVAGNLGATTLHQACEALDSQLKQGNYNAKTLQIWLKSFDCTMAAIALVVSEHDTAQEKLPPVDEDALKEIGTKLDVMLASNDFVDESLLADFEKNIPPEKKALFDMFSKHVYETNYLAARTVLAELVGEQNAGG